MASGADGDRSESGARFHWVEGIVALILFAVVVASLALVVPRLQVYWANFGIVPPPYGRALIWMSSNLFGVVLVGVILVGLAFRRRD